jgi:hypothetical protein
VWTPGRTDRKLSLPPDLRFAFALAILGVVMFSVSSQAAFWLGVLLVLAALIYAQIEGARTGHSFVGDLTKAFGGGG